MNTGSGGAESATASAGGAYAAPPPSARPLLPVFVPVRPGRINAFVARIIMSPPQRPLAILRWLWPIPRGFGWALVLRYDDVAEVLRRHDVFRVPFGDEIARLNDGDEPGTPFVLGIDDDDAHSRQTRIVMQAFRMEDIATNVAPTSFRAATRRLTKARRGAFDGIHDLITAVPVDVCREYFGVDIPHEREQTFAYATIELSGHLFGFPPIRPTAGRKEDDAGAYVRAIVDRSIERELAATAGGNTTLARLVAVHRKSPGSLPKREIRSVLIGMITGFIPTNTMAGGHILEMLLGHPEMLKHAQQAAETGDDDRLMRCLFEALRFMPINLGPFRICAEKTRLAADTPHAATIRRNRKLLAMTSSAMFDSRHVLHPFKFDPGRPASNYMHFGFGMHWCAGAMIARAQITQTFKALLLKSGLARVPGPQGKLALWGLFPDRLCIEFDED